jgi:hypothetical protein
MWRKISLFAVPLGIAIVAACGSKTTSGGSNGGNGGSSSSGGGSAPGDAGILCGLAPCSQSDICCYASGTPTCKAAGSCMGSAVTCASNSACPSSQTCCFTYEQDAAPAGLFATPSFTAQCQDSCPSTSYQLCTTTADCTSGDTCVPGPYARYCAPPYEGGAFVFPDGGFVFPRRDAAPPPGEDGSSGDDASGDDATVVSTMDAASE